jgi:hypothetical protein
LLVNGLSFGLVEPGVSTADEIFETLLRHRTKYLARPLLSMRSSAFQAVAESASRPLFRSVPANSSRSGSLVRVDQLINAPRRIGEIASLLTHDDGLRREFVHPDEELPG